MSHQTQRSGQPVSRRNADGRPARVPSPWMEKKISLTVSTALGASLGIAGAAARRFPDADPHQLFALGAERPLHLAEEVARHGLGRRALAREVLSMTEQDFLLLDIWAKQKLPHSVYDDITWTGFIGRTVPDPYQNIFNVVRDGRDAAIRLVQSTYPGGSLFGWQVDDAARQSITAAGYGEYFIHRTGHSIHEEDHGNGANIDNLETSDSRRLMRGTCFSIEPGVYLKGKFGVRSEVNVYLAEQEAIVTGQPVQSHVVPILSL